MCEGVRRYFCYPIKARTDETNQRDLLCFTCAGAETKAGLGRGDGLMRRRLLASIRVFSY